MRITSLLFLLALCGCVIEPSDQKEPRAVGASQGAAAFAQFCCRSGLTSDMPHLENLLEVTDRIYSGGEPVREEAFEDLVRLGIRTIVSVDGARPKLKLAEKHGLRYVHIPIGYDGIPDEAGRLLTAVVRRADGPFYVHCHHGKHRGPAAAAIAGIADGDLCEQSALAILAQAGTSKGYGGLWRDVAGFAPPADGEELPELVPVAEVGSLAAAMARIDRASGNLKQCQVADWRAPSDHPDIAPVQQALLLKEGFREIVRQLVQTDEFDDQFLTRMKAAEQTATQLEAALNAGDMAAATSSFSEALNQCSRCHREHRD